MRIVIFALALGCALGILSRLDELNGGSQQISQNATWLAVALLLGACAATLGSGIASAVIGLTTANVAYYLYRLLDDTSFARVANAAPRWIVIGVLAGLVFGALGRGARVAAGT